MAPSGISILSLVSVCFSNLPSPSTCLFFCASAVHPLLQPDQTSVTWGAAARPLHSEWGFRCI